MPIRPTKTESSVRVAPASGQTQQISTPAAAFGSAQAEATLYAARALGDKAEITARTAEDMARRQDETQLLEYETKIEEFETQYLFTGENPLLDRVGNEAFGSTKQSITDFKNFADDLDKQYSQNPRIQNRIKSMRTRKNTAIGKTVSRHEANQRRAYEESARNAALESARDRSILYYTDPVEREASLQRIESLVRETARGMPPEAVEQMIEDEKTKVHTAIIDRFGNESLGSAESYYKQYKDQIDPNTQVQIEKSLSVLKKQQQAEVRHEVNKQANVLQDAAKITGEINDGQFNAIRTMAEQNGLTQEVEALDVFKQNVDTLNAFVNSPLPDQPTQLRMLREKVESSPTRQNIDQYNLLRDSFDAKLKILKDDPVSYYEQQKVMRPYQPADISNPQAFAYEMTQRRVAAAQIEEREQIKLPLLRKSEIENLSAIYSQADTQGKTSILRTIQGGFTQSEARQIAQKIAPKQANMAAVMAIAHESPDVAQVIASGSTRDKFVPRQKMSAEVQNMLEGAIPDGAAIQPVIDAVHDAYTELAFMVNDTSNELDPERMRQASEMILGPKLKVKTSFFDQSPSQILPFKLPSGQWISEGQFESALNTIDADTLLRTHGDTFKTPDGQDLDVQETIGRTRLQSVGDGQYILLTRHGQPVLGSVPEGTVVTQNNIKDLAFKLDMKKVVNDENVRGLFESFSDYVSKSDIDRYIDAQKRLTQALDSNAPADDVSSIRAEIEKIRKSSASRAKRSATYELRGVR